MYLETKRLVLRSFRYADGPDLHEMLGDAETMRFLEPAYTEAQTEQFLRDFCMDRKGAVAAEEKESGRVIGYLLFHACGSADVYELGWIIHRDRRRQGYAFETCRALIEYGFGTMKLREIFAETVDGNASVGLMRKLGMQPKQGENGEDGLFVYHMVNQA